MTVTEDDHDPTPPADPSVTPPREGPADPDRPYGGPATAPAPPAARPGAADAAGPGHPGAKPAAELPVHPAADVPGPAVADPARPAGVPAPHPAAGAASSVTASASNSAAGTAHSVTASAPNSAAGAACSAVVPEARPTEADTTRPTEADTPHPAGAPAPHPAAPTAQPAAVPTDHLAAPAPHPAAAPAPHPAAPAPHPAAPTAHLAAAPTDHPTAPAPHPTTTPTVHPTAPTAHPPATRHSPPAAAPTAPVEPVVLDAGGGLVLSGLVSLPQGPPRALLVALHGGGMRAGYFAGPADPAGSLLALAAACGFAALAVDRPGYGASARHLPDGLVLEEQAARVAAAVDAFAASAGLSGRVLVAGHSLGGKLALALAARPGGERLLGVDVNGLSDRWAIAPDRLGEAPSRRLHWGPLDLYPPGTFQALAGLVGPMPAGEAAQVPHWPRTYARLAPRVRVPVRFAFAEHERLWRTDPDTVARMTAALSAPFVRTEWLPHAGHNISLGRAARTHHLRVLAFAEECLLGAGGDAVP
ncbi:alpha/beta fold hydrolase [Streptomyces sp. NPDC085946]|uniref:alpha/beta fold hydrolase n=1 Tax=Streptomyces sp. NPDC085946 TaxID=3365744 RepID=UPI0037D1A0F7